MEAGSGVAGAVLDRWTMSPLLVAMVPGGLWRDEAPELDADTGLPLTWPWAILSVREEGDPQYTFNTETIEASSFTITVFESGAHAVQKIRDAVKTAFRPSAPLTIDGGRVLVCLNRLSSTYEVDDAKDRDGNAVWASDILFDLTVHTQRG